MAINTSKSAFFNGLHLSAIGGVLLSAVLVIASCASSAGSTAKSKKEFIPTTADDFTKRGIEFLEKGDSDKAIEDFTQALKLESNYVQAYIKRGIAYTRGWLWDKALYDFNDALMLDPNNAEAYYERGVFYTKDGGIAAKKDYDKAIADFTKAIQINPNYAEAYYQRGLAYCIKKDYDKAIADFTKAIQINPENYVEIYRERGDAYLKKGDYDKAIADYNKVIPYLDKAVDNSLRGKETKCYDRADVYSSRGDAYIGKGDYKQAFADFEKAIADYNKGLTYNEYQFYRIKAEGNIRLVSMKRKDAVSKGIAAYTEALRINPKDAEAYNNRGEMYLAEGDRNKAIEDFTQARQLDTSNQTYRANLDKARGR
jgi:tetratricopeptide (TPR) repeat protein